jgi:hypothetical protein
MTAPETSMRAVRPSRRRTRFRTHESARRNALVYLTEGGVKETPNH